MKEQNKPIVGITIGDINGIGPEIILKTFLDARIFDFCTPIVFGSYFILDQYKEALHLPDVPLHKIKSVSDYKKNKLNVLDCLQENVELSSGHITSDAGKLAFASLKIAVDEIKENNIDVLLTAPINKKNVREHCEGFIGHTGYLAQRDENESLMMLNSDKLKVTMATGHVALGDVKSLLTTETIINKLEALNKCLIRDFGISRPKIAVLGLNPHAGEEGLMGTEETDIIQPAISEVKTKGLFVFGPYPSDGFFGSANYTNFDAVLAMYHDQALIPFKTLSFESGINFTAGLSFIRTSPDHGTAYEIAGKRLASESSFRAALYQGCDIFKQRRTLVSERVEESV